MKLAILFGFYDSTLCERGVHSNSPFPVNQYFKLVKTQAMKMDKTIIKIL